MKFGVNTVGGFTLIAISLTDEQAAIAIKPAVPMSMPFSIVVTAAGNAVLNTEHYRAEFLSSDRTGFIIEVGRRGRNTCSDSQLTNTARNIAPVLIGAAEGWFATHNRLIAKSGQMEKLFDQLREIIVVAGIKEMEVFQYHKRRQQLDTALAHLTVERALEAAEAQLHLAPHELETIREAIEHIISEAEER